MKKTQIILIAAILSGLAFGSEPLTSQQANEQLKPVVETRELVEPGLWVRVFPNTLKYYFPLKWRSDTAWILSDEQMGEIARIAIREGWSREKVNRILRPYDRAKHSTVHLMIRNPWPN